ncbi:MAG: T9SS type A sorting domain-containing protein [Ignavibacteriales bacterium]|nr:MAG: T9SS type A sorting domain-containing protein [Ignavibacteriales bacterium]
MKLKTIVTASLIMLLSTVIHAQVFSNGTGGGAWGDASTWLGGVVPSATSDVVIAGGDSVYTTGPAICRNLSVYADGIFATSVDTIGVSETLLLENDSKYYNRSTNPKVPGSMDRILEPNSTVIHSGSGTVGGEGNLEFGNLMIQRNEGCVPGGNLVIHGNLIINNSASNVVFRGVRPVTGSQSHLVEGDLYVLKGTMSCIDVGDNGLVGVWDILGNVYVIDSEEPYFDARLGTFSSANAAGLGIINIGGDLVVQGGRIQAGTSSSAGPGVGIVNVAGNVSIDANSSVATNSLGSFSFNFIGTGQQYVDMDVRFYMGTAVYDTVKAGSEVVFDLDTLRWGSSTAGDFVVEGSLEMKSESRLMGEGSFTLQPGGTLKIGSAYGITLSDTLGNIRVNGTRSYNPDANYEYKSDVVQAFGDALPNPVGGFAVNNPNGFSLNNNLTVNNSLKILNGDLDLNGNTVTLGTNAMLTETNGNTVKGSTGKLITVSDLNTPSSVNVGGFGAVITSASNLGSTTVERFHSTPTGGGNEGVTRVFNILPSNNTGLNATLRFYYDESELNGIPEERLQMVKSPTGNDGTWERFGSTVDPAQNYVELSGISDFSYWTLADSDHPLPVEEGESTQPVSFALEQNYPNPFNPSTIIKYQVPELSFVSIKIYDVLGNEVAVLLNELVNPGFYSTEFVATDLVSGLYFCTLKTEKFSATNKMLLLK